jgi:hypothetical protein
MRWCSPAVRAAVAACLLGLPISATSAQPLSFTPATRFTLSGCWTGVSCHSAVITLYNIVTPPSGFPGPRPGNLADGDLAIGYQITHSFLSGSTGLAGGPGLFYQYPVVATGGTQKILFADFDFWSGNCLSAFFGHRAGSTCTDGYDVARFGLGGRVATPGWTPQSISLILRHVDDPTQSFIVEPYEQRTVTLQLVSTEVLTTPEPSAVALVATGLGVLGLVARRRTTQS